MMTRARHRFVTGAALLLLVTAPLACGQRPDTPGAVVLIVIDTLRYDRLGSSGYAAARTPHLDALAARGLRFTRARTPVPVTLPAISSLITGRYPFRHGVRDNDLYVLPAEERTLAERFAAAGWRTAAVVASAVLAADRGVNQGFEIYDDVFVPPYAVYDLRLESFADEFARTRRRADTVTDKAIALARGFENENYFLFVHYFDVHSYYDPPPAHAAHHPGRPYDGELSFCDEQIGRLLQGLGGRDDVLVALVSDHGEGLGDHGEPEHGFLLHDSTLRVPWLVAGPGVPPGSTSDAVVSLTDVAPSLAAACRLPKDAAPLDGVALSWSTPQAEKRDLYAETMRPLVSYHWSELRALIRAPHKLITGAGDEVYDLTSDPGETNPMDGPLESLTEGLAQMTGGETRAAVLAALIGEPDPQRKDLLESLGYVGDISGREEPDRPYPHPRDELPRWLLRQREKSRYRTAMTLAGQGQFDDALALFDTLITQTPDRADLYYNRGMTRRGAGDPAGFQSDIQHALRLDPQYVPALERQAERKTAAGGDARRDWMSILELHPENLTALHALSRMHLEGGQPELALPYLRTLSNVLPEDAVTRFNLGLAALRAGREDESRRNLELFLRLAPDDPRAESVRNLLREAGAGS